MILLWGKGKKFKNPDRDSGYILTRDVYRYDLLKSDQLKPYGGEKELMTAELVPLWLSKMLKLNN